MAAHYSEYKIRDSLSSFVECIWFNEQEEDSIHKIIPDNTIELIFTTSSILRQPIGREDYIDLQNHLSGLKTKAQHVIIRAGKIAGVRFKPEGLYPFTTRDISKLINTSVDLEDAFGRGIKALEHQILHGLRNNSQPDEFIKLFENYLLSSIRTIEQDSIFEDVLVKINQNNGNVSILDISKEIGCSIKTIERKFKKRIGISPKSYCSLQRFHQSVLAMGNSSCSLAHIAYDHGYFDHMHFSKQVKNFASMTPKEIYAQKQGLQFPTLNRAEESPLVFNLQAH